VLVHPDRTVDQGLTLHYQPIVELAEGAIRGFEALIRWTPPERRPVPASVIIEAAEHTGLIVPLGGWVISKAIAEAASIPDAADGTQRYVSINVSPTQLRRPDFVDNVVEVLAAACVHPSKVIFELVETQPVSPDCHQTWSALGHLRDLGARVAIDDFGAGYAALSHLRQPVVDILKLDRVFCRDTASSRSRSLIRSAVVLAEDLGIELVVE
jgi:EAL domain-containing protein (putative c-di-GMP-specific phosphodiesterase class I)